MTYIDQYHYEQTVQHNLGIAGLMKEHINRSGAYVGPPDPFAPDDFRNQSYYLPKVSEEVKERLIEAIRHMRMAYVYESRFLKLMSGEDDEEDFLRILDAQLDEMAFHKCENCGVRDTAGMGGSCRYCGETMVTD